MTARAAVLLALVVCLSGCAGVGVGPTGGEDPAETGAGTPPSSGVAADGNGEDTALWGDEPIVVAIEAGPNDSRNWTPLVASATDFWSETDERYLGYPVEFAVRPNATDPDVRVRFVESIRNCEGPTDPVGCAPYYTEPDQIERPTVVEVETGLSDESTEHVLKHEFGHVLGLGHDDRPQAVMNRSARITTLTRTNATERATPWNESTLTVSVDDEGVAQPDAVREEIGEALSYYERGANGTVPEETSFELVSSDAAADVVVSFPDTLSCREGDADGSCAVRSGTDADGDGAVERYEHLAIELSGVQTGTIGWHVAYWLGYGFGFTEEGDWPEPLATADDPADRRGKWWTR